MATFLYNSLILSNDNYRKLTYSEFNNNKKYFGYIFVYDELTGNVHTLHSINCDYRIDTLVEWKRKFGVNFCNEKFILNSGWINYDPKLGKLNLKQIKRELKLDLLSLIGTPWLCVCYVDINDVEETTSLDCFREEFINKL